jgi:hypothetical protein
MGNIKYIALLILFLIPVQSIAQIELVRPSDFRYYVTVDGDTVSSRSLDYKAVQDAVNYKEQYPGSLIVIQPLGIEVRGSLPVIYDYDIVYEEIIDTVFVDEVVKIYDPCYDFCEQPLHSALDSLNLEVRQAVDDSTGSYRLAIDGITTASAISVATNCYGFNGTSQSELINERSSGRADANLHGDVRWESGLLQCRGIMTLWVTERDSGNFRVLFSDIGQILSLE